jgi:hypothetical protein
MQPMHYALLFRLEGRERFLLWYSADLDGVTTDGDGRVLVFADRAALTTYCAATRRNLAAEDAILHDLDRLQAWLLDPSAPVDCNLLLTGWNLFEDVERSVAEEVLKREGSARLYELLFYGSNLPAMTPTGSRFDPLWTPEDRKLLQDLLARGLARFRARTLAHA